MTDQGKKIAILVEDQSEEMDLWYPYFRLMEEGFEPIFIAISNSENGEKSGFPVIDMQTIEQIEIEDVYGVIIPNGYSPDMPRFSKKTIEFVKECFERNKIVAAIRHQDDLPVFMNQVLSRLHEAA